jgi:DMSO/TMAO reductase YedYZ molybdopterin-dependent catalytic subunit
MAAIAVVPLVGCSSNDGAEPAPASPSPTVSLVPTPFGTPPAAADIAPTEVNLTVVGDDGEQTFTREQLAALPQADAVAKNPKSWLEDAPGLPAKQNFTGVPLSDFFIAAGIPGDARVRFSAADDYTVTVPVSKLLPAEGVIAIDGDGVPLTPEYGGPVRLVFPAGSDMPEKYWVLWLQKIEQVG